MNRVILAVLLFIMAVKADEGGDVSFSWGRAFTMTCPKSGEWFQNNNNTPFETDMKTLQQQYNDGVKDLQYRCKNNDDGEKSYHFYIRGKACEWCVEATTPVVLTVLLVDILGTGLVIMMVYLYTKRNNNNSNATGAAAASKPGGRRKKAGRGGPPTPSPDYEQLNIHTRSPDTYATVNNRTG